MLPIIGSAVANSLSGYFGWVGMPPLDFVLLSEGTDDEVPTRRDQRLTYSAKGLPQKSMQRRVNSAILM